MISALALGAVLSVQTYRERFPLPDLTVPNGWGVNIHFTDPKPGEMELIRKAGFKWIRMDLTWGEVERRRGVYDWRPFDRLVAECEKHNFRLLFILDYGNDVYEIGPPRTPDARLGYSRFAAAAAYRYRGKGILWEIWNEPNHDKFWPPKANVEEYARLAKEATAAIRAVAPEEYVVGGATSRVDFPFLEGVFLAGLLKDWDAVTVHPYRQESPETAAADFDRLRRMIDGYAPQGKKVPIFSGEWGYSENYRGQSEKSQGHMPVRSYLTNLASGIPLSIWYDWKNDGTDRRQMEHWFGLVDHNLVPKSAYKEVKRVSERLSGYAFYRRIGNQPPGRHWLQFKKGDDVLNVSWSEAISADAEPVKIERAAPDVRRFGG